MNNPLIDVHIEKTAGRSMRQVILATYGAERVLNYDPTTDRLVRASSRLIVTENKTQERIQNLAANGLLFPFIKFSYLAARAIETRRGYTPEDMPTDFDAITGHLSGDRFFGIFTPDDARYTSVLREPLARMRSQYEHWYRTRGLARFRVRPDFNSDTSFEQFALLPEMHNYQTVALGANPERYILLGISDRLPEYLEELGLPTKGQPVPHINRGHYVDTLQYDSGFLRDFSEANELDNELYAKVAENWPSSKHLSQ